MRAWIMMGAVSLSVMMLSGCGDSRPDPKSQPGFKDTTDPGTVRMPQSPPGTPGMPAGAGATGAGAGAAPPAPGK